MTPGAVFDCMLYLQAAGTPTGPAGACLDAAEAGLVTLFESDETRAEAVKLLDRPSVRKTHKTLTDARVAAFFARIDTFAVRIDPVPPVVTLARDPKDERYLNLAVAARASFIVTRDNDLLDLMTGTDPDAVAFRANHPGIAILTPAAFLAVTRPTP